ncbi:MAG: hypothetical protein IJC74_09705 [Clostridia bacterium]|nr:hypothetical protein [Clostridia bacterium]
MRKILSVVLLILLFIGLTGCSEQIANQNAVTSAQELQGFWLDEDGSGLMMGFKEDRYILYAFVTQISISGTFEVEDKKLIVHPEEMEDKIYTSAIIDNGILTLETTDGQISRWKSISEEEVKRMLSEDE